MSLDLDKSENILSAAADHCSSIAGNAIVVVALPFQQWLHMRKGSEIGFYPLSEPDFIKNGPGALIYLVDRVTR